MVNVYTKEVLLKVGNEEALKSIEQLNHEGLLEGKSYLDQLEVLGFVIKSIAEKTNLDEKVVRTLFHKAHFSGNILEIGRLVEETFGKVRLDFYGTMDSGGKSALRVLDHLQKQKDCWKRKSRELSSPIFGRSMSVVRTIRVREEAVQFCPARL